jgi:hypothetical protein
MSLSGEMFHGRAVRQLKSGGWRYQSALTAMNMKYGAGNGEPPAPYSLGEIKMLAVFICFYYTEIIDGILSELWRK